VIVIPTIRTDAILIMVFLICDDFYDSPAASSRHQCFSGHPAPQLELCKERNCFSSNVSMKELP
jgi:hypothetical protein